MSFTMRSRAERMYPPPCPAEWMKSLGAVVRTSNASAPARDQDVADVRRSHRAQRDVVDVVGPEGLPHVALGRVVQLHRPGGPRDRVGKAGAGPHFGEGQLVHALRPARLPAAGEAV